MTLSFRNAFGATLLGLAAVVAAPTASAAIVTGSWDPALPHPFVKLGWTATINLQTNCTPGGGNGPGNAVNIFGGDFNCNGDQSVFTFLSAQIGFYDLTSRVIVEVLTLNELSFTPEKLVLTPSQISQLRSSTDSDAVRGPSGGRTLDYWFKLGLPGKAPQIKYATTLEGPFTTGLIDPIQTGYAVYADSMKNEVLQNTFMTVGQSVPAEIPEPGSLALALLALGAAGAAASRRKRRGDDKAAVTA